MAYAINLSHYSFDLLLGTPFLKAHDIVISFLYRTITMDGLAPLLHLRRSHAPPAAASGEYNILDLAIDIREGITAAGQLRDDLEVHVWYSRYRPLRTRPRVQRWPAPRAAALV